MVDLLEDGVHTTDSNMTGLQASFLPLLFVHSSQCLHAVNRPFLRINCGDRWP